MFEVIGMVSVLSFMFLILILQYSLMILGIVRDDLTSIGRLIGWIPLLPFILMVIVTVTYTIIYFGKCFNRWFEMNWGWVFVNGRKRNEWAEYIRNKYNSQIKIKIKI